MSRPYFKHSMDELENLVDEKSDETMVLRDILSELERRKTDRAKQLAREIRGTLEGRVRVRPPSPPEDSPENQLDMLGDGD